MWLEGVSFLTRSTIPALSQYRSVKDIYLLGRAVLEQGKQGEKKGLTQGIAPYPLFLAIPESLF